MVDSIIISSETRGGSTWLMELLSADTKSIINWEPLHEVKGVVPKHFKWGQRPYIPENINDEDAKKFLQDALTLKVFSKNSIRYVTLKQMFNKNRVLTKMVRSNLLLPWLTNNFEFTHKPVYVLRHPIAVAQSQLMNIPESKIGLMPFEIPDVSYNERYRENASYINSLKTPLERLIALWCIHNMEIINHPENDKKWVTVYYEHLVLNPEEELRRIAKEINLNIDVSKIVFNKPSKTDFHNEFEQNPLAQLSKWKKLLGEKELKYIQEIFDHYGLKNYSTREVLPIDIVDS